MDLAGSEKLSYISKETSTTNDIFKSPNPKNFNKFTSPASSKEKENLLVSPFLSKTISKDRFKESQYINKSLFFLTTVISLIKKKKKSLSYNFLLYFLKIFLSLTQRNVYSLSKLAINQNS